jgi:CheY-like chemotaxis protein
VKADPARLAQILANLLNNAAKYTPDGGAIWLTVEREENKAVFRIRDTGAGIAPDMLPRIFEPFIQADQSLDRSQGGLGIGLTLARRLVEMHGGTIEAHSAGLGQGSEFNVRLPAIEAVKTVAPSGKSSSDRGTHCRVLVVDDNVDAAESLAMLVGLQGHEVRVAHDGYSALEQVTDFRADVVLLDIGLVGLDGYEVARRLRRQSSAENLLLIAVTGYGRPEDRFRSREAGFDYHLVKPVDPDRLCRLLANLDVPVPAKT